jgi:hypothetical protein
VHLLGALAAAMIIHGVWNAAAVGLSFSSIAMTATGDNIFEAGLEGLLLLICVAVLSTLTLIFIITLPLIARRLSAQEKSSAPAQVEPPAL